MTNLEKANKEVLTLLSESKGLLKDIRPLILNGVPKLVYSQIYDKNKEVFLFSIEGKRKFFIEARITKESEYLQTHPRFELSSWYDDVVDLYLRKYQPYIPLQESLASFIINDLPNLTDHKRDKNIYIQCFTHEGQGNIGHFRLDPSLLKLLAESGLCINYVVQLQ